MSIRKAELIAKMRVAFKAGKAFNRFYLAEKVIAPVYRRSDMLRDWANINQLVQKEGRARYIRKGYIPAANTAQIKAWAMSKEWMYTVRSQQVLKLGEPPVTTFINIMSDKPLTIAEIEQEAYERSFTQSPPKAGEERKFSVESAIHRAEL